MAIVRAVIVVVAVKGWSLHQMDVKNSFFHGVHHPHILVTVAKGWSLLQMDVKNAFLHGDVQEEVCMT